MLYVCTVVNALFGWCVAPWRFDVRFGAPQRPCEGGRGRRARGPPSHAARGAVAARSVRAATKGTLRRDFAKGLFEGTSLDFSKGLSKGLFSQGLNIFGTTINNRFKDNGDYTVVATTAGL